MAHRREIGLAERCRAAGLKVTPQRLAIYGWLAGRDDHPSPEQIFQAVRGEQPMLSLATVYKTLDSLESAGLVREVVAPGDTKRFDANMSDHHHLVCTLCGGITDFVDAELESIRPPKGFGFKAETVSVQILGRCERCERVKDREGRT